MADTSSEPPALSAEELIRVGFVHMKNHPVLLKKLTLLRKKDTPPREFRTLVKEITFYLGYEATETLATVANNVETPLGPHQGVQLAQKICIIPILRAGLGMVDSMLDLLPNADVHHIGMYRNRHSLLPIQYYNKLPRQQSHSSEVAFILDPMIAGGATISAVVSILKQWGSTKIVVVCIVASRPGLARLHAAHPDITVHCGAIDEQLTPEGFISPGLGDAGDRLFSTPDYVDADVTPKSPAAGVPAAVAAGAPKRPLSGDGAQAKKKLSKADP